MAERLGKYTKNILLALAQEFDTEVSLNDKKRVIINSILGAPDYDEKYANSCMESILKDEADRIEQEAKDREREFELTKLKLGRETDSISMASSQGDRESRFKLKSILPKFDLEKSEISIYLNLFERQAKKSQIEKSQWVTHLLGLLPTELGELILREPTDLSDDFDHVKKVLLERFQLTAEDFRIKFVRSQKLENKTWKDFVYEVSNYFDQWLSGLEITTFDQLKELIITDQLKKKVNSETKLHFIDSWNSINTPFEFAKKLDAYDSARKTIKNAVAKVPHFVKSSSPNKIGFKQRTESKPDENKLKGKEKEFIKRRDEIFDKRKEITCFNCKKIGHYKYSCPEIQENDKVERINHVELLEDIEQAFKPYISRGKINGKEMTILRDSGTNLDLVSAHDVTPDRYINEKIWLKQPLQNDPICLPMVEIELDIGHQVKLKTKAAVVGKEVNMEHYLLGNKTQELIEETKTHTHRIKVIEKRKRERRIRESKNSVNKGFEYSPIPNFKHYGSSESQSEEKNEISSEERTESVFDTLGREGETPKSDSKSDKEITGKLDLPRSDEERIGTSLARVKCEELKTALQKDESLSWVRKRELERIGDVDPKNGLLEKDNTDPRTEVQNNLVPLDLRTGNRHECSENTDKPLEVIKSKEKIFRNYSSQNTVSDRVDYVESGDPLQNVDKTKDLKEVLLTEVPTISSVVELISTDSVGNLQVSENGKQDMLTMMSVAVKYPDPRPLKDLRSVTNREPLNLSFDQVIFPNELLSDLGAIFMSNFGRELLEIFGIELTQSPTYRPQSETSLKTQCGKTKMEEPHVPDKEDQLDPLELGINRITDENSKLELTDSQSTHDRKGYLGYVVEEGRRTPHQSKSRSNIDFPTLKFETEMQKFLSRLVDNSHYYVHYVQMIEPMTHAWKSRKKKEQVIWDTQLDKSIRIIKKKLKESPVLLIYAITKLRRFANGRKFGIETHHNPLDWLKDKATINTSIIWNNVDNLSLYNQTSTRKPDSPCGLSEQK